MDECHTKIHNPLSWPTWTMITKCFQIRQNGGMEWKYEINKINVSHVSIKIAIQKRIFLPEYKMYSGFIFLMHTFCLQKNSWPVWAIVNNAVPLVSYLLGQRDGCSAILDGIVLLHTHTVGLGPWGLLWYGRLDGQGIGTVGSRGGCSVSGIIFRKGVQLSA